MHVQLLFTLGSGSKLRYCEYIYHCSGIGLSTVTTIVRLMKANTCNSISINRYLLEFPDRAIYEYKQ